MSDNECYECFGEVLTDSPSTRPFSLTPTAAANNSLSSIKRHSWLRTSLRKSPPPSKSGRKVGSNSFAAGHLCRSSSFNSSGKSSGFDATEDGCSDISLEEDVLDLNHKVQMLQQQVNVLADNQNHSDERYTRVKQENATLKTRISILEEQLRDKEINFEEKHTEEVKRHRELVARVDREKQLEVENSAIRLQSLERDNCSLKEETIRCRNELEIQRKEKAILNEMLEDSRNLIATLQEEIRALKEQECQFKGQQDITDQVVNDLTEKIKTLKAEKTKAMIALESCRDIPSQIETELQMQLDSLKQEHRNLQESHEELQAILLTRSVHEGRTLLSTADTNNLAAELDELSCDAIKSALKEQQEVNTHLRAYIDNILLNVVENYPQLLEVKRGSA